MIPETPDGSTSSSFYAMVTSVSSGFFATMGVPIRSGRDFSAVESTVVGEANVAIVSEQLAAKMWGQQNPLGKRLRIDGSPTQWLVVGVVGDVAASPLAGKSPRCYVPLAQLLPPVATMVLRTDDPSRLISTLSEDQPNGDQTALLDIHRLADSMGTVYMPVRLTALVLGLLGALGLAIAILGVYGVMAFFVSQRTREFGVRRALGATGWQIQLMVVHEGLRMLVLGTIPGICLALIAARFLERSLYQVVPYDLFVFGLVPVTLVVVGLAASMIAAVRASRVEPTTALRQT